MAIEYRIGWSASSNVRFHGETDWQAWDGEDGFSEAETPDEVEQELIPGVDLPRGLQKAIDASGFEWYVETREASS